MTWERVNTSKTKTLNLYLLTQYYLVVVAHILALNKPVFNFFLELSSDGESGEAEMQSIAEAAVDCVFKGEETGCQKNCPFALHLLCEEAAAVAIIITHRTHTKATEPGDHSQLDRLFTFSSVCQHIPALFGPAPKWSAHTHETCCASSMGCILAAELDMLRSL